MTATIDRDLIVGFALRESDMTPLVLWRDGEVLRSQPRQGEKSGDLPTWADDDYWIHVRSGGRYSRRAMVDDCGVPSWYYVGTSGQDSWVRAASAWEEPVEGTPRFVPDRRPTFDLRTVPPYMDKGRYTVAIPAGHLDNFFKEAESTGGVDLDPDFQRGHAWTPENQRRFLEHLLRGGEHGRNLVWNDPSYGPKAPDANVPAGLAIVDGKQRLTAIMAFLKDEVPVFGGHVWSQFDRYSRLEALSMTGRLRLQMTILGLQHRSELLRLYIDLNEGAVAHDPAEIARVKALLEQENAK